MAAACGLALREQGAHAMRGGYGKRSGSSKFAVHALRDACVEQAKQTYEFGAAEFGFHLVRFFVV